MKEFLLGFDIRINEEFPGINWKSSRISTYLLKSGIIRPVSVDKIVYPRHDEVSQSQQFLLFDEVTSAPHWLDGQSCVIAITYFPHNNQSAFGWMTPLHMFEPSSDFTFLGFDIADEGLLSGLMNCGGFEKLPFDIRHHFASGLNDFHLFDNFTIAEEFRLFSNERVIEHAPFFVFGIYKLNKKQ